MLCSFKALFFYCSAAAASLQSIRIVLQKVSQAPHTSTHMWALKKSHAISSETHTVLLLAPKTKDVNRDQQNSNKGGD